MIHSMKLLRPSFEKVVKGERKIEGRIFDDKRQLIRLNDYIDFFCLPDLKETVRVRAVGLHVFPNFSRMSDFFSLDQLGWADLETKEAYKKRMREFYTEEEERENGVIGIEMELV